LIVWTLIAITSIKYVTINVPTLAVCSASRATPSNKSVARPDAAVACVRQPRATRDVATDILRGADEIAQFLFGTKKYRRRVYNLVERNELPIFRIGASMCARKSVLLQWIEAQEYAAKGTPHPPRIGAGKIRTGDQRVGSPDADSGPSRTVIPAHCGQQSGDCGQFLMSV
jgi:hypothetical protein